jgi:import receptor subunit TOM20
VQEIGLIKRVLTNKVPGIDQFLTDDIYLMLKGKLSYNSYPVPGVLSNHLALDISQKVKKKKRYGGGEGAY